MQIGHGKEGVLIGEYGMTRDTYLEKPTNIKNPSEVIPDTNPVLGYIEPACDNAQWILWFMADGSAILHQKREPTGGVLDYPIRIKAR